MRWDANTLTDVEQLTPGEPTVGTRYRSRARGSGSTDYELVERGRPLQHHVPLFTVAIPWLGIFRHACRQATLVLLSHYRSAAFLPILVASTDTEGIYVLDHLFYPAGIGPTPRRRPGHGGV